MKRIVFFILGCIFLVIGIAGIILPVLPGTINLILAAGFFAKSSPRLESWMLNHPRMGPTIRHWREYGSISRKHKTMAVCMMWAGITYTIIKAPWFVGVGMSLVGVWTTWYIISRPTRIDERPLVLEPESY